MVLSSCRVRSLHTNFFWKLFRNWNTWLWWPSLVLKRTGQQWQHTRCLFKAYSWQLTTIRLSWRGLIAAWCRTVFTERQILNIVLEAQYSHQYTSSSSAFLVQKSFFIFIPQHWLPGVSFLCMFICIMYDCLYIHFIYFIVVVDCTNAIMT